jgi:hypothetical protein
MVVLLAPLLSSSSSKVIELADVADWFATLLALIELPARSWNELPLVALISTILSAVVFVPKSRRIARSS